MRLRTKLALALAFTALLPMGVAVGLPMLQAERRAQQEASRRLEATLRQMVWEHRWTVSVIDRITDLVHHRSPPRRR